LRAEREPHLRRTVRPNELRVIWAGKDGVRLQRELAEFREALRQGGRAGRSEEQDCGYA
jgi:hypothetical protein